MTFLNFWMAIFWRWVGQIYNLHGVKFSRYFIDKQELSSSWDGRPFGDNRHGPKSGGCCAPFRGRELSPHLTQRGPGQGLSPYQVASWFIQPFGHSRHGPKIGGFGGELSSYLTQCRLGRAYLHAKFHLDPSNRLATIHQRYRQDRRTDRQRSDSIGRTVLQTVAQKLLNFFFFFWLSYSKRIGVNGDIYCSTV